MRSVFADANYWIALLNPHDELHQKAIRLSSEIVPARFITTEMVLTEVLNFFSCRGEVFRAGSCRAIRRMRENPNVTVIPQTSEQFSESLSYYESHGDREWGATDCASFMVMRECGLTEALTNDQHFQQAGFMALLRE